MSSTETRLILLSERVQTLENVLEYFLAEYYGVGPHKVDPEAWLSAAEIIADRESRE